MENRPRGRQKNITGASGSVNRRGSGLGSGPVGRQDGYSGRTSSQSGFGGSYQQRPQNGGQSFRPTQQQSTDSGTRGLFSGGLGKIVIIVIAALVLFGGGGIFGLFGGDSSDGGSTVGGNTMGGNSSSIGSISSLFSGNSSISSLFGGSASTTPSSTWTKQSNTGKLDTTVASGAREKYTKLLGSGNDTVTLMVYLCGTDLESKNGMASADLQEMLDATVGSNINLLVYTGGCKSWKNNTVSSSVNQIYKVEDNGIRCLEKDYGNAVMTKPSTLNGFIKYCMKNYQASRYGLILWDHGGGSLSGYGYDEKNASAGSMTLKGIREALSGYEKTFDFIGFDACLMGTLETGLTLAPYADYLIASEETEPGIGWYYKTWLTKLSQNTSISTVELGKSIVDSFVSDCESRCSGQKATLSVVDLAELSYTAPAALKSFAVGTSELLDSDGYQTVANARAGTREFATSSKIDQIDLVDFAYHLDTDEANAMAEALLGAVKYNNTASCMSNAYGISIYFPYRKTSGVNSAVATYNAIGLEDEYTDVIRQFAGFEASGQAVSGSSGSPLDSLLGGSSSSAAVGTDAISQVLSGLMSSGSLFGRELNIDATAAYLAENQFDATQLGWKTVNGTPQIALSEAQWSLVQDLAVNVFYDDGEGYIDLGIDNSFNLSDDGALLGDYEGTWLAIDGTVIPYYYIDTVESGDSYTITGRVPVLLNGDRAELILVFDDANPNGYVAGARAVYLNGETETIAKGITELSDGDEIDFLCDYYTYDGEYLDSYRINDAYVWHGQPEISDVYLEGGTVVVTYLFTDIYNNEYWTPALQ